LCPIGLQFPPGAHHAIFDEAHEASCRLQARELLDEQLLGLGLADVHRTTAPATVVVRVVVAASFRPSRRQRFAARLATGIAAEREVRIVSLLRGRDFVATGEDSLHAEENALCDERFEVAASRDSELRNVDLGDVGAVPQHGVERLTRCAQARSRRERRGT
jgi:hypothetical protein